MGYRYRSGCSLVIDGPPEPHKGSARSRGNREALYKEAWEVCVIPDGEGAGRSLPPHLPSHHFLLDFIFPERFPAGFSQNGPSQPDPLEFFISLSDFVEFLGLFPPISGHEAGSGILLSSHIPKILGWEEV